jgi:hypothetical protein
MRFYSGEVSWKFANIFHFGWNRAKITYFHKDKSNVYDTRTETRCKDKEMRRKSVAITHTKNKQKLSWNVTLLLGYDVPYSV